MCFSATASFAAAGVTAVAGVGSTAWARRPAHFLLACIPLFFAVHQAAEGVLWLALSPPGHVAWVRAATFTYLGIAKVVWPIWVPLAIWSLEPASARSRALPALLGLGIVLAVAEAYGFWAYPVSATISGGHIQYGIDAPAAFRWTRDIAYVLVTVLPPLFSHIRLMRLMGLAVLASLIIAKIFFYATVFSVWCFFAALISALVAVIVWRDNRPELPNPASVAAC
jgi:hypothetical protein